MKLAGSCLFLNRVLSIRRRVNCSGSHLIRASQATGYTSVLASRELKVLGGVGEDGLKAKLNVTAHRITASARKLIEGAGGKVNEQGRARH